MSKQLEEIMRNEGIAVYPKEACGLIVTDRKRSIAVPCKNVAEDPCAHFMIDPTDYANACQLGEVIGVWHTHVELSPKPSEADLACCEVTALPWYIMGIYRAEDGSFHTSPIESFGPSGFEMPYVGRPYVMGVFDCFSLLRDFYGREFNIPLKDYPRIREDGDLNRAHMPEVATELGFVRLLDEVPRHGDVFLIQTDHDFPGHIAIYLEGGLILHHMHGRLSMRDVYGGYWFKHTTHHLRYGTQC